jgi:hypothetical protein
VRAMAHLAEEPDQYDSELSHNLNHRIATTQ